MLHTCVSISTILLQYPRGGERASDEEGFFGHIKGVSNRIPAVTFSRCTTYFPEDQPKGKRLPLPPLPHGVQTKWASVVVILPGRRGKNKTAHLTHRLSY